jgi:hypothetical protein
LFGLAWQYRTQKLAPTLVDSLLSRPCAPFPSPLIVENDLAVPIDSKAVRHAAFISPHRALWRGGRSNTPLKAVSRLGGGEGCVQFDNCVHFCRSVEHDLRAPIFSSSAHPGAIVFSLASVLFHIDASQLALRYWAKAPKAIRCGTAALACARVRDESCRARKPCRFWLMLGRSCTWFACAR